MDYYDLGPSFNDRSWHISLKRTYLNGQAVDIWAYSRCEWIGDPLPVPLQVDVVGRPVSIYDTAFGALVFSSESAGVVSKVAPKDIQRIPVEINAPGEWEVVNVLNAVDCIDYNLSVMQIWPSDHPKHPNKPRGVVELMLDPCRINPGWHIFKPKDWLTATIVSETLKIALEEIEVTGVRFIKVT